MSTNIPFVFTGTPYTTGVNVQLTELLSYKQHGKLSLNAKRLPASRQLAGNYLANIKGRGMEFAEVRHYQAGDDVRAIDWAVTARTGKAHTKLFQEEKERPVFLLLDVSDSMIFGSQLVFKSVQACHLAALLSWQAKQRNDRLGGIVFNQQEVAELKPTSRNKGLMAFLHQTQILCKNVAFKTAQQQSLLSQLKRLSHLVQTGSQVHLISDFSQLDDACYKLINLIRRHNQVTVWQISDPLESHLPKQALQAGLKINAIKESGFLRNQRQQNSYQEAASQRQQLMESNLLKYGIAHYHISSAIPLLEQFNVYAQ
ncbi:DUF58 domain-containing protein [Psychromonas sp. RZ22]|uniref:DUF58 domain-containing protein n=1 Tax=Psychromonas algarum TaxID=2555643 RepID=UPI00106845A7|nr:DUF58 domain-containing protein [Psychromonas sp. RZ22]TEW53308.1 DUF58 domain-containing protein [Psychromonas sp. RZ22]